MTARKRYKITEIFSSVQGEGFHAGRPATFVRFAGCNGKCPFCDTDYTERIALNQTELLEEIDRHGNEMIVFTGGEPLLQLTWSILRPLRSRFVAVETNGSIDPSEAIGNRWKEYGYIDWLTVSPKNHLHENLPRVVNRGSEVKVVWNPYSTPEDILGDPPGEWDHKFIQPEWNRWKIDILDILAFLKKNQDWKLSVQIHKFLNLP